MVQDKTINKIVTHFYLCHSANYIQGKIKKALGYDIKNWADCEKLAQEMFDLNARGVNEKYGAVQAAKFRPLNFKPAILSVSAVSAFKAAQCWLYQCAEGTVPENIVYKFFQLELIPHIAEEIVESSAEYDNAEWG